MKFPCSTLAVAGMLAVALSAEAHDFSASVAGQTLYFNVSSASKATAEVTYKGSIVDGKTYDTEGVLEIPAKIKHNDVVYEITGIGAKAFAGATSLTGIVLPSTIVRIGDFAFEGCTALERVVFPGRDVTFGQGVFFKCSALRDLSFGSDCKTLDLDRYRWSDSLQTVTIPAKVEKVAHLKSLKGLRQVDVDPNNPKFSSRDGVLYDKNGTTLYGVPRNYEGTLRIADGTKTVSGGALIDCFRLTAIFVPASVTSMSFRETSRMESLEEIVFAGETPPTTAYKDGKGCFLLQVANSDVTIKTGKDSKSVYEKLLVTVPGEYAEKAEDGSLRYAVGEGSLPKTKKIKGLKNFNDYEQQ